MAGELDEILAVVLRAPQGAVTGARRAQPPRATPRKQALHAAACLTVAPCNDARRLLALSCPVGVQELTQAMITIVDHETTHPTARPRARPHSSRGSESQYWGLCSDVPPPICAVSSRHAPYNCARVHTYNT